MSARWTDKRIVIEAETLAEAIASELGFQPLYGLYCNSDNPRRMLHWGLARLAMQQLLKTDPDDAVSGMEQSELDTICLKLGRKLRAEEYCS